MWSGGSGSSVRGAIAKRQLGTEHRRNVELLGGFGESHHPVQPVVVGQRDGPQVQPGGLLDEFLRRAGAVEEAVRRMRMQLGIGNRRAAGPRNLGRLIASTPTGPGRTVAAVAVRPGESARHHGEACR